MVFGLSKNRYSPIAVDYGADSLKLLQVVRTDPPQLVAAAAAVVPDHARTDPSARHAFYLQSLKHLLKNQAFKGNRAICSIPSYQTLVQQLQVSRGEGDDFNAQVDLQLRQRLNIDPARMVVRTFQVGQVVRNGAARQELVCIAASRDAVMHHIDTAHRAKLNVVGMHSEPLAILQAFDHMYIGPDADARTTCFIDVGGAVTTVVIAHGREMVFAKTIHAAGDHFTRQLAKARSIAFNEARDVRMAEAVSPGGPSMSPPPRPRPAPVATGDDDDDDDPGGVMSLIQAQMAAESGADHDDGPPLAPRPEAARADDDQIVDEDTLDCLIDELQMCVRYHHGVFPDRPIEKLVFLGGEALHRQTCQTIARALRIGAQLGDPLARVARAGGVSRSPGVDLAKPQPGWAVPLGLCLSDANL